MNTGLVSTRYANALLDYAIEMGQQDEVYARMKLLSDLFSEVPELKGTVQNPSIPASEKKRVILIACGPDAPSSLEKMIELILTNEREGQLQFISLRFIEIYRTRFNIQSGRLITAIAVDDVTKRKLTDRIRHLTGSTLEIESVVDPNIIGGFILTLDDYRWDASVTGELERIKLSLRQ